MGCCDKQKSVNQIYLPLNERLVEFARQNCTPELLEKYSFTKMYVFSFLDSRKQCIECTEKLGEMISWFEKYNLMNDPINNIKWIFEDEMEKNHIITDLGFKKSPMHLFCDSNGYIMDIVVGFPNEEWLEKYLLPMIRK